MKRTTRDPVWIAIWVIGAAMALWAAYQLGGMMQAAEDVAAPPERTEPTRPPPPPIDLRTQ